MRITQKQKLFWLSECLVLLAAVLYCSWPLGFVLNPLASRNGLASELGAVGQPYNWVFIGGDVVQWDSAGSGRWRIILVDAATRLGPDLPSDARLVWHLWSARCQLATRVFTIGRQLRAGAP